MSFKENEIIGTIEFLEVKSLEGSTYHLEGPNREKIKLNASEVNEDDDLEIGSRIAFSSILTVLAICLPLKTCQILLLDGMILYAC